MGLSPAKFAYAAVAFFVIGMAVTITQAPPATFAGAPPPVVVVMAVAFTAFHLSLLPVVAGLDAPAWAKGSGYAWIVVDNVLVFMSYFGVGGDLVTPMRWGVHLATATWIAGASSRAPGAMKWVDGERRSRSSPPRSRARSSAWPRPVKRWDLPPCCSSSGSCWRPDASTRNGSFTRTI